MNIKKRIVKVLAAGIIFSSISVPAYAEDEESTALRGWTEESGYWTAGEVTTFAATPDFHRGWVEYKPTDITMKRAAGETQWKGVRHYTRARLENRNGAPVQDSMRQYDTGYTSAKSPYGSSVLTAKTYWGR